MGLEVNRFAEWRAGLGLQSEARVGAANVDDDDWERYDEITHGGAINAASRARRQVEGRRSGGHVAARG
jgi:hypothetical protein